VTGTAPTFGAQGEREARSSGRVERELIVRGGTRRARVSVGVGETAGDKALGVAFQELGDEPRGS
jgi:hypothetical protein